MELHVLYVLASFINLKNSVCTRELETAILYVFVPGSLSVTVASVADPHVH